MLKIFCILNFYLLTHAAFAEDTLRISTTTSTENSGLLDILNPLFTETYHIRLEVIAVGTGKALRLGINGDVDIVFVHAAAEELKYVKNGDFINRMAVMHNDFVLIGPQENPALVGVKQAISQALKAIAINQAEFISRGDDSGTHKKELDLWHQAKIVPKGSWYVEVGQSMGAVINIADEKQAYTLTDRGTYLALKDKTDLVILNEGDPSLFNPYHIMIVNPEKHQHVRYQLARQYLNFITSSKVQAIIGAYKKHGEKLFYPDGFLNRIPSIN